MPVRLSLAAIPLMAAVAAGLGGLAELNAAANVRQSVLRTIGRRGEVSVGSVWANPVTGHVTLTGLVVRAGSQRLHVGRIDLAPGLALPRVIERAEAAAVDEVPTPNPGTATSAPAGKASADDVTITSGGTTTQIAHIEASGTSLDRTALLQILQTTDAEPLASRLRNLTAASILVSELKVDRSDPASEMHWVARQILLANVVKGRATAASIGPTSLAVRSGSDAGNAEIVGQDLKGIDLVGVAHALEATRVGASEPLLPLIDSWTINSIRYADVVHDRVFTLAAAKATDLKGRAAPADLARHLDAMKGPNAAGSAGPLLADLSGLFAIGSLELDDGATKPGSQSGAAPGFTSHFDRLRLTNVGGSGPVGSLDLVGYELDHLPFGGADNHLAVGSAHVAGFRWQPAAAPGGLGQPLVDAVDVDAVTLRRTGPGHDETAARVFTLKHAALTSVAAASGSLPAKATFAYKDLAFDPSPDDATKALADLGYKHVDLSGHTENSYDPAAQTFHLAAFDVGGAGLGSLHLALDLANVGPDVASPVAAVQQAAVSAIQFKAANLSIKNDGLVERLLAQRAQMEGRTVPAEQTVLESLVTDQLPTLIGSPPKLQPLEKAIAAFIADPKQLDVTIASPRPVGATDFAASGPLGILDTLQIEAVANP